MKDHFKKGDIVICVKNYEHHEKDGTTYNLKKGEKYKIEGKNNVSWFDRTKYLMTEKDIRKKKLEKLNING